MSSRNQTPFPSSLASMPIDKCDDLVIFDLETIETTISGTIRAHRDSMDAATLKRYRSLRNASRAFRRGAGKEVTS